MYKKLKSKYQHDSNLLELLQGSAITFILKVLGMIFGYVAVFLISHKNGAEGVGYYSMINQLLYIVGLIAAFGTDASVLRYVGQYNNDKERPILKSIFYNVIKITTPFSLAAGIILFLFSPQIASHIFKAPQFTEAIQVISFCIPFFTLDRVSVEFIRGLKKIRISEFIRTNTKPIVMISFIAIYWSSDLTNITIIYFVAFTVVANFLISQLTILKELIEIKGTIKGGIGVREMFVTSSPMMISNIVDALMYTSIIFILQYFSTPSEVGIFAICWSIVQGISIVLMVVNTIAAPKYAELFWQKKMIEMQKFVSQSTKMMFYGSLAIAILLVALSYWILLIFGEEYLSGQIALFILIFGQLVSCASGSVGLILNMSNHQKVRRNSGLISLLMQTILAFILIPPFGLIGAAIASVVGFSAWNIICAIYVKQKLKIKSYISL